MAILKSNFCTPLSHASIHEGCLSLADSTYQLFSLGSESPVQGAGTWSKSSRRHYPWSSDLRPQICVTLDVSDSI